MPEESLRSPDVLVEDNSGTRKEGFFVATLLRMTPAPVLDHGVTLMSLTGKR
jgi:hypothetical protein